MALGPIFSPASLYLRYAASQPSTFSICAASRTIDSALSFCAACTTGITGEAARAAAAERTATTKLFSAFLVIDVSIRGNEGLRRHAAVGPLQQGAISAQLERRLGKALGAGGEIDRLVVHLVLAAVPEAPGLLEAVAHQHVGAVDLEDLDALGAALLGLDGSEVEAFAGGLEARVPIGGDLEVFRHEEGLVEGEARRATDCGGQCGNGQG